MAIISKEMQSVLSKTLPEEILENQFCALEFNLYNEGNSNWCEGVLTLDRDFLRVVRDGEVKEEKKFVNPRKRPAKPVVVEAAPAEEVVTEASAE